MGSWYNVIKTVKGHKYAYKQTSWREGDKVKTKSIYLGRADKLAGYEYRPKKVITTKFKSIPEGLTIPQYKKWDEKTLVKSLFNTKTKTGGWHNPWGKPDKNDAVQPTFTLDKSIMNIAPAMTVTCKSQPLTDNRKTGRKYGGDGAWYMPDYDSLQIPDHSRYRAANGLSAGQAFYNSYLHEIGHASGAKCRLDRIKPDQYRPDHYEREELVAELTACLVANRLGIAPKNIYRTASYLQYYLKKCMPHDQNKSEKRAVKEATRAADYIMSHYKPLTKNSQQP